MSEPIATLALRKQLLVARSALNRLRIKTAVIAMQDQVQWLRRAPWLVGALSIPAAVAGLTAYRALSGGLRRALFLASRAILIRKLPGLALKRNSPGH